MTPTECLPTSTEFILPTTVHETLQVALDLLRTDGWCRGHLRNSDGEYCARGALVAAVHENFGFWGRTQLRMGAEAVLCANIPADFEFNPRDLRDLIPQYNNSRTDFSEVEAWFEKSLADETVRVDA